MNGKDVLLTIVIIVIFMALYFFNILSVGIKTIQDNWPEYRCNPMVMPFASVFGYNTSDNFTYCIQSMQSSYMSYLTQPFSYNLDLLTNLGGNLSVNIDSIRSFISNLRDMITNTVESIFGVFLNILIEFQRTSVYLKDMFAKLIGVMTTVMYLLQTITPTGKSGKNSTIGKAVLSLCFEPNTIIKTADSKYIKMKNLKLGTNLNDECMVQAVLKISNVDKEGNIIEPLYKIKGGEKNQDILVTGSHLIFDKDLQQFIKVADSRHSALTDIVCKEFACLVTTNHTIPIGRHLFHDWDTDVVEK